MSPAGNGNANVRALKEAHDNFNERNFEALKQKAAEGMSYRDRAGGRVFEGRDEWVSEWLQFWIAGFPDARLENRTYIDGGNTVTALVTGRGTNDGAFGPFPSTGKHAEFRACEIIRFDGSGKMVSGEVYYDRLTLLVQLGHIQEPQGG